MFNLCRDEATHHAEKWIPVSWQKERNTIALEILPVFLSQHEENWQHDHIVLNLQGNENQFQQGPSFSTHANK